MDGPFSEAVAIYRITTEAHDARYIQDKDFVRTIAIDTTGYSSTDFRLTPADKATLYASGEDAARKFLDTWDFARYVADYRSGKPLPSRHERLLAGP